MGRFIGTLVFSITYRFSEIKFSGWSVKNPLKLGAFCTRLGNYLPEKA